MATIATAEGARAVRRQLAVDLGHLIAALGRLLRRQRTRGRSPAGDALQGMVIEEGEAEGLLAELAEAWARPGGDGRARGVGTAPNWIDGGRATAVPWHLVARQFRLDEGEFNALLLALAVEMDARFGRLVAFLNDHAGRPRPTLGLAADLGGAEHGLVPLDLLDGPLFRDGLLELDGDGPVPALMFRMPREVLRRLVADGPVEPGVPGVRLDVVDPGRLGRIVLNEPVRERLIAWACQARREDRAPPLILAGPRGRGRSTAARAAVSEVGLPLVTVELEPEPLADRLRIARRESRWNGAGLLLREAERPVPPNAWREIWAGLDGLEGPIVLAVGEESVEPAAGSAPREPTVVRLEAPGIELRARLWRALLPRGEPIDEPVFAALAGRFPFSAGQIARAVRRARAEVELRPVGERRLVEADLERACREIGSALMGPLAEKLPLTYRRADLVVPDRINAELDLALAWSRHRRRVLEQWGLGRRVPSGRGLALLFAGPPGTGKTMAAQVLARELGVDLYRIDLSRVLSKYIGETEERLRRLFDEAETSGAALFFDEADALFGKRSEVKDAHDRYANVEISYLLQRIESFDGVAVLASNRKRDLDEAFLRRFPFLVDFPMPDEADRLRIWQGLFPPELDRAADLDLAAVAKRFEMSGGEIKNAVLAAAVLAARDDRPVAMTDVLRAVRRELLKAGRVVDERTFRELGGEVSR